MSARAVIDRPYRIARAVIDGPYSFDFQTIHTDVSEKFQLGGKFIRVHFSNCTTRSKILSAITRLLTSGISSVWPEPSMIVA